MILAILSGNEFTDVGVYDSDSLIKKSQFVTPSACTADEYTAKLRSLIGEGSFEAAVIADVSEIGTDVIKSAAGRLSSGKTIVIGAGVKTGLNIRIDNPATLGANLVAGAVGAAYKYGSPAIVCDCGMTTAFTVTDKNGAVRGGALIPGFNLSLRALSDNTAALPRVNISADSSVNILGTNTESCMKAGIVYAAAAITDSFVKRYRDIVGEDAAVILTGQYAKLASKYAEEEVAIDENLALDGLYQIYKRQNT
jgi:type III pantothenate kinase